MKTRTETPPDSGGSRGADAADGVRFRGAEPGAGRDPSIERGSAPAQRVTDPAATRTLPSPADSGTIVFTGDPGSRVSLDGRIIGEMPISSPVRAGTGVHAVVFTRPPFEPIVRTVQVNSGEQTRASGDFLATAGYLRCTAVPWAEISVDDIYRETTPTDRLIAVSPGTRRVKFHHPRFRDSVKTVMVAPRETLTVSLEFRP